MWYRHALNSNIKLPGRSDLKPGYFRAFHSTNEDAIPSIREYGLRLNQGHGTLYSEPSFIWGKTDWAHRWFPDSPTVEFQISPEILKSAEHPYNHPNPSDYFSQPNKMVALTRDIPPDDIIEIYDYWMDDVLYLLDDPETFNALEDDIKSGNILGIPDNFIKAYNFIKEYIK